MRWELHRFPRLLLRLREDPPRAAESLRREHLEALRSGMRWEKATFAIHFAALRQFVRWAGNSFGEQPGAWTLPSGAPSHRRWLTRERFGQLLAAARGDERLLVALEGLNGLRRIEVLRLRKRDVLSQEKALCVLGKGRYGGKWRKIPMHPTVELLLRGRLTPLGEDDRIFGLSASGADALLRRASDRAKFPREGVKVSHHDLRRTFGRLANEAGMDLVQLKNLYGHSSIEMTVHYIGLDTEQMRRDLHRLVLAPSPIPT